MRKYVAVLLMVGGVLGVATTAHATSISSCAISNAVTGQLTCDLFLTDSVGNPSTFGTVSSEPLGFDAGWLVGYAFVLNAPDPTVEADIDDVVVFHSDHVDLFSQADASFGSAYAAALAGTDIDSQTIATGQVVGDILPFPSPDRQFNPGNGAIGLFYAVSDPIVAMPFNVFGCCDIVNINTPADFSGTTAAPVPEPATLTLVGLGGAIAAYRRRRRSKA